MVTCNEYLGCSKKNCPAYNKKDGTPCWQRKNTLCCFADKNPFTQEESKELFCKSCIYYLYRKDYE